MFLEKTIAKIKSTFYSERIRRLTKEGFWIVIGQFLTVAASLVLVRVLTEHLDPAQYGQLALALTLGTLVAQVAFSGSMPGIMRFYTIAAEKGAASEYLLASRRMMGYGIIVATCLIPLILLGLLLFGKADMLALTGITIVFAILGSCNANQSAIQNAARQRRVVALHGSLDAWIRVLFAAGLLTWLGNSAKVVVAAYIASLALVLTSQAIFIRRLIPVEATRADKSNPWVAQIWRYSKPFVFFNAFGWIQASSDRWALDTFSTAQDVGLYAVLIQLGYTPIAMVVGLMTNLIGPIMFQRSGDTADSSRNVGVHKRAWQMTAIALLSTLLACLFAYLFHDWIFRLLVAAQYRSVSYLLPWMILAGGLFSAGQVLSLKLMSDLNTKALLWPKIVTSLVGALLSFVGAYFAGVTGVVFGAVAFSVLHLVWLGWLGWHPIGTQNKGRVLMAIKRTLIKIHWLLSSQFGTDPQRFLRSLRGLPTYVRDWVVFRKSFAGKMKVMPCLHDRYEEGGATKNEYFWQDLLVARFIHAAKPVKHVDIGSRVDGFVGHVASFREIEVFDVRPITTLVPGVVFRQADLMNRSSLPLTAGEGYCDSLSCLHAVEHFGLGRYGDPVDPQGYQRGIANMSQLLRPRGTFYLSAPIGQERVEFNANWVFDPRHIVLCAEAGDLTLQKLIIITPTNEPQEYSFDSDVLAYLALQRYLLGLFVFTKANP